jgi:predicted Fe-S protein YdhL (DUF1289 family)
MGARCLTSDVRRLVLTSMTRSGLMAAVGVEVRNVQASPCVRVCRYSPEDLCLGCLRLRTEVSSWARLDEPERQRIADAVETRRQRRWEERMARRAQRVSAAD